MFGGFAETRRHRQQPQCGSAFISLLGLAVVFVFSFLVTMTSAGMPVTLLQERASLLSKVLEPVKLDNTQAGRTSLQFVEAEIDLSGPFSLEDISTVHLAPDSPFELLEKPKRLKVQLPAYQLTALVSEGTKATVLSKFILLEGSGSDLSSCSGAHKYGESRTNINIPGDGNDWAYSNICISAAPPTAKVSCLDVHYEIIHNYAVRLLVDLTNQDFRRVYHLWEYKDYDGCYINETETGVTEFNGEPVNQLWRLWALDAGPSSGEGYIDYWWIKLYYDGPPAPANDDCTEAIVVSESGLYVSSSVGAGGIGESVCGFNYTNDVWHSFVPKTTGVYSISLCGSSFDTMLAVYNECGGTELVCNDDFCGLQSEVTINLAVGNTYLIRIAGFDGRTDDYTLTINRMSPPPNDDCRDAIAVVDGVPYSDSTVFATGSYESCCSFGDTADVWHSYTPPSTGLATISLRDSTFDATLAVFDGCGGSELACNNDISSSGNTQLEITMAVVGAQTYLVRIAGNDGDTGNYTLEVNRTPCVLPNESNSPSPENGATIVPVDTILSWNNGSAKGFQSEGDIDALSPPEDVVMPEVIYGVDDFLEECEVYEPDILSVGDSIVALVVVDELTDNGDGTFSLPSETYAEWYERVDPEGTGNPLCLDEPYHDQPNPAKCSGFLIAPDIIATAGRYVTDYECGRIAFVFGFVMDGPDCNTPVLTIDESEIYYCSEVIGSASGSDWALIRLDREVVGHSPLRVRLTDAIDDSEPLLVVGHPAGLARKYTGGAEVENNNVLSPFFGASLDKCMSNSGSAVFNAGTLEVEGILVRGNGEWKEGASCDKTNLCPDSCCAGCEEVTRTTEFTLLFPWAVYDVYFGTANPPTKLIYGNLDEPVCKPYDPCRPGGRLACGTTYYWRIVAKNFCDHNDGPVWSFTTEAGLITVDMSLDGLWMYQNLSGRAASSLTGSCSIINDPMGNSSYTYEWKFVLPPDVNMPPTTIAGGQDDDSFWSFAAAECDQPNGISDSGRPFKVKLTVTGDDYGNIGTAEAQFGIALLGDVDNDGIVDVADRSIINAFWRNGSAWDFTLRDCDVYCDGLVDVADRSIANSIWRGNLGQNSISKSCPFR